MLSPLPTLLTTGNLALPEAGAPVRDSSASGGDFASLMQRQSDRQAALREIDQQMARPHRPTDRPHPPELRATPRPAPERNTRPAETAPERAGSPDGTAARRDASAADRLAPGRPGRDAQGDAAAQARATDDTVHQGTDGPRQRLAAGMPATPAAAPQPPSADAGPDSLADDGGAETALPASTAAGSASIASTTQWARSRLAARVAAGGLTDLATPVTTGRPGANGKPEPAGLEVRGTEGKASSADMASSLALAGLTAPPSSWPAAAALLPPAATATPTSQDLGARLEIQMGAVTLAPGASLSPTQVLAPASAQPASGPSGAVGAHPGVGAPAAPVAAGSDAVTAGLVPTAPLPSIETAAASMPASAMPAAAGAATGAASAAAPAPSAVIAQGANAAAATPAVLATGAGRPAGRLVGEPAGPTRDADSRSATRSAAAAADLARAAGQQPAAGDSLRSAGATTASGTDAAATSGAVSMPAAPPADTPQPDANASALPAGPQPAAVATATDTRAAAPTGAARSADANGATLPPATQATAAAAARPEPGAVSSTTAGLPAAATEPGRPREDAGSWTAGNPGGPAPAAGMQAPQAAALAAAARADRSMQGTAPGAQSSTRAEAVADLAGSFNALPLAPQVSNPAWAVASSSAALPVDAQVPVPLDDPGFGAALGTQVSVLVRDGVQTARLQLNPAELGPIAVQIALDGSAARVDFQADLAGTRAAIEASLPALAGALQDAGFTLAGGGVFQQTPGRQGQGDAPATGQARQADGSAAAASMQPADTAAPRIQRGLVDLVA